MQADGRWVVQNAKIGQQEAVLPDNFDFSALPILITVADQGPLNVAALDHLQYHRRMAILPRWGIQHSTSMYKHPMISGLGYREVACSPAADIRDETKRRHVRFCF